MTFPDAAIIPAIEADRFKDYREQLQDLMAERWSSGVPKKDQRKRPSSIAPEVNDLLSKTKKIYTSEQIAAATGIDIKRIRPCMNGGVRRGRYVRHVQDGVLAYSWNPKYEGKSK